NGGGDPGCMGWAVEPEEVGCALAVAMHPDDIEAWCAGTVAALVGRGARVAYLLLTSGDKGSADPLADPRRIAATREAEQRDAARTPRAVPGDRSRSRPPTDDAALAPHAARAAWLFDTDRPNRVVDIAATLDARLAARAAHASQTRDLEAMARAYRERAATT